MPSPERRVVERRDSLVFQITDSTLNKSRINPENLEHDEKILNTLDYTYLGLNHLNVKYIKVDKGLDGWDPSHGRGGHSQERPIVELSALPINPKYIPNLSPKNRNSQKAGKNDTNLEGLDLKVDEGLDGRDAAHLWRGHAQPRAPGCRAARLSGISDN